MPERVGVVIVNYNSGGYLLRCLEYLCRSLEPLSIVVVDNNSTDNSLNSVEGFDSGENDLNVIKHETNRGFSVAVNIGRKNLDCEYLMLLNPDSQVHPHSVSSLRDVLKEHPEAGIVGALVFNEDGTEQRGCRRNEPTIARSVVNALGLRQFLEGVDLTGDALPDKPFAVDAVSGSAMMARTRYFDEIGGMDESYFLHCEDLDVCRKMRDAGHHVLFEPRVSIFHRQGGSTGANFRKIEKLKHQGMMRYYLSYYGNNLFFSRFIAPLLVWSHYFASIARDHLATVTGMGRSPDSSDIFPFDFSQPAILVSGASTDVGNALLSELKSIDKQVIALTRVSGRRKNSDRIRWLNTEYFSYAASADHPKFDEWIHVAPIWTAKEIEKVFTRGLPKRMIGVSSSSVEVKSESNDPSEKEVVDRLMAGELWFARFAKSCGATFTLLRPTMIYGGPTNKNINLVKRIISLVGCFPLVGSGSGKRQPVHFQDVASACKQLLGYPNARERYNIAGGNQLSYREMVEKVFYNLGKRPRFIVVSRSLARNAVWLLGKVPGLSRISPESVDRMLVDQTFSIEDAKNDFGFNPRDFNP